MYKKKHSLDFDMMRTKIYLYREGIAHEQMITWIMHFIVGAMVGILAFMLTFLEDKMTEWRS